MVCKNEPGTHKLAQYYGIMRSLNISTLMQYICHMWCNYIYSCRSKPIATHHTNWYICSKLVNSSIFCVIRITIFAIQKLRPKHNNMELRKTSVQIIEDIDGPCCALQRFSCFCAFFIFVVPFLSYFLQMFRVLTQNLSKIYWLRADLPTFEEFLPKIMQKIFIFVM